MLRLVLPSESCTDFFVFFAACVHSAALLCLCVLVTLLLAAAVFRAWPPGGEIPGSARPPRGFRPEPGRHSGEFSRSDDGDDDDSGGGGGEKLERSFVCFMNKFWCYICLPLRVGASFANVQFAVCFRPLSVPRGKRHKHATTISQVKVRTMHL